MVADVIGENNLHADVIEQIVARTDGIPLFVEELTKTVVETGRAISEDKSTSIDSMLTIPATLQDSLMARLDRLVSGKEVAQVAACIGREFSYELICTVAALVEDELATGLRALVDADLIYQSELPPRARYTFKHALIQDTAYQSLLKATRQRLHARIANQLEKLPATVANQPELLALHYTGAGLADQATSYWLKAG